MTCYDIAKRISMFDPGLSDVDVARLTLMILIQVENLKELREDEALRKAWNSATFRLEAAADQHAAVANELEAMCNEGPIEFTSEQIWVLLRAVKVQSQILELYTDQPALA